VTHQAHSQMTRRCGSCSCTTYHQAPPGIGSYAAELVSSSMPLKAPGRGLLPVLTRHLLLP
jgi:hypothetical protein